MFKSTGNFFVDCWQTLGLFWKLSPWYDLIQNHLITNKKEKLSVCENFGKEIFKIFFNLNYKIWDTAGQERFRTITATYYRGANGVLVVFDLSEPATFVSVKKWLQEIANHCDEVPRVLVGNKLDAPNRVVEQAGKIF